jgi:transcriptional regulator with XRE-family HTH domain
MTINSQSIKIRQKKLGVLIKDARLSVDKNPQECARIMHVTEMRYLDYEYGILSPSLPELEVFAYQLNIPIDHFWGNTSISAGSTTKHEIDTTRLINLRQRIIGAKIKQARQNANLSLDDFSQQADLPDSQTEAYELGKLPIPLPLLELLADIVNIPFREFFDSQGPIGSWETQQRTQNYLSELPPDLIAFITKPVNRPYLELAQRLSEMSAEKLRAVAEGLLEITL